VVAVSLVDAEAIGARLRPDADASDEATRKFLARHGDLT
jgi:hypothetical protein